MRKEKKNLIKRYPSSHNPCYHHTYAKGRTYTLYMITVQSALKQHPISQSHIRLTFASLYEKFTMFYLQTSFYIYGAVIMIQLVSQT